MIQKNLKSHLFTVLLVCGLWMPCAYAPPILDQQQIDTEGPLAVVPLANEVHQQLVDFAAQELVEKENDPHLFTTTFQEHFAPLLTTEESSICFEICQLLDQQQPLASESNFLSASLFVSNDCPDNDSNLLTIVKKRGSHLYSLNLLTEVGSSASSLKMLGWGVAPLDEAEQALYAEVADKPWEVLFAETASVMSSGSLLSSEESVFEQDGESWLKVVAWTIIQLWHKHAQQSES